jgi:hypothetical protein
LEAKRRRGTFSWKRHLNGQGHISKEFLKEGFGVDPPTLVVGDSNDPYSMHKAPPYSAYFIPYLSLKIKFLC